MFKDITKASQILIAKLESWYDYIITMLPNMVIAMLVIILFYILSRLINKGLSKILHKVMSNESAMRLILSLASVLMVIIGIVIALGVLKLDKTVTSVLAGVGVIGLALGLAFQDAAANLISGIIMAVQSPINIGDIIESNDIYGTVKIIGLRATTIYDMKGQDVVIPNRLIMQNIYKHYTINGIRRVDLKCGISYGDNLHRVEELSIKAIEQIPYLKEGQPVDFFFEEFGSSSINFVVRYWVAFKSQSDYLKAQSDGIKNLKDTFDKNGITIPFPIRTLDFGIKGGQRLSEILNKEE